MSDWKYLKYVDEQSLKEISTLAAVAYGTYPSTVRIERHLDYLDVDIERELERYIADELEGSLPESAPHPAFSDATKQHFLKDMIPFEDFHAFCDFRNHCENRYSQIQEWDDYVLKMAEIAREYLEDGGTVKDMERWNDGTTCLPYVTHADDPQHAAATRALMHLISHDEWLSLGAAGRIDPFWVWTPPEFRPKK